MHSLFFILPYYGYFPLSAVWRTVLAPDHETLIYLNVQRDIHINISPWLLHQFSQHLCLTKFLTTRTIHIVTRQVVSISLHDIPCGDPVSYLAKFS